MTMIATCELACSWQNNRMHPCYVCPLRGNQPAYTRNTQTLSLTRLSVDRLEVSRQSSKHTFTCIACSSRYTN